MTQLSLLQRDREKAAKLLDRMLSILSDGSWVKGRYLCAVLHTNERVIRSIASLSEGRIVSSDKGYKLTRDCSVAELDECENRLRSQARQMLHRVIQIRKARNRGGIAA